MYLMNNVLQNICLCTELIFVYIGLSLNSNLINPLNCYTRNLLYSRMIVPYLVFKILLLIIYIKFNRAFNIN